MVLSVTSWEIQEYCKDNKEWNLLLSYGDRVDGSDTKEDAVQYCKDLCFKYPDITLRVVEVTTTSSVLFVT